MQYHSRGFAWVIKLPAFPEFAPHFHEPHFEDALPFVGARFLGDLVNHRGENINIAELLFGYARSESHGGGRGAQVMRFLIGP
jgi:hypothetical protein